MLEEESTDVTVSDGHMSTEVMGDGDLDHGHYLTRIYLDEQIIISQRIEYGTAVDEERYKLNDDGTVGEKIERTD